MTERTIISATIDWEGITLLINYEPDWLSLGERFPNMHPAHLEVKSIKPERARLPFTETGYRSSFLANEEIEAAGGAVAFVEAWLAEAANTVEWREYRAASQQLSLF